MLAFSEFVQELSVLEKLPHLSMAQQVQLDRELHADAINKGTFGVHGQQLAADSDWKKELLDVFLGKQKDIRVIRSIMAVLERDIASHQNRPESRKTGSAVWHKTWIAVYRSWLNKLGEKWQNECRTDLPR